MIIIKKLHNLHSPLAKDKLKPTFLPLFNKFPVKSGQKEQFHYDDVKKKSFLRSYPRLKLKNAFVALCVKKLELEFSNLKNHSRVLFLFFHSFNPTILIQNFRKTSIELSFFNFSF